MKAPALLALGELVCALWLRSAALNPVPLWGDPSGVSEPCNPGGLVSSEMTKVPWAHWQLSSLKFSWGTEACPGTFHPQRCSHPVWHSWTTFPLRAHYKGTVGTCIKHQREEKEGGSIKQPMDAPSQQNSLMVRCLKYLILQLQIQIATMQKHTRGAHGQRTCARL